MFKKSVVIRAKGIKPIKLDYKALLFFSLMICGIIIGVSLIKNGDSEFKGLVKSLIDSINNTKSNNLLFSCVLFVIGWLLVPLIVAFFSGLSGLGLPFLALLNVLYGMFCGLFCGIYYVCFGLQGIGFFSLVNLPCYAITAATLIKCCCESLKMSFNVFSFLSGNCISQSKNKNMLKEYILTYLILCLPVVAGSFLNVISFKIFGDLFSSIII